MLFYSLNLQKGMSPIMMELENFHDSLLMLLLLISSLVGVSLVSLWFNKNISASVYHKDGLEVIWTLVPAFVILGLASPSLILLYFMDYNMDSNSECLPMKVMGHQWYWHYDYDLKGEEVSNDCYMITPSEDNKDLSVTNLLETDVNVVLPAFNPVRFLVTGKDVLHSFALPSLGVKIDAVPGRLNQQVVKSLIVGKIFGQCSEICGANHSFMPIEVEFVLY